MEKFHLKKHKNDYSNVLDDYFMGRMMDEMKKVVFDEDFEIPVLCFRNCVTGVEGCYTTGEVTHKELFLYQKEIGPKKDVCFQCKQCKKISSLVVAKQTLNVLLSNLPDYKEWLSSRKNNKIS